MLQIKMLKSKYVYFNNYNKNFNKNALGFQSKLYINLCLYMW